MLEDYLRGLDLKLNNLKITSLISNIVASAENSGSRLLVLQLEDVKPIELKSSAPGLLLR